MRRARVRRPSLLGTAARTAVVAGTASTVVRAGDRRAAERAQQAADAQAYREQQAVPPPPPAPTIASPPLAEDRIAQLERLAQLHASGVLTDTEFAAEKARILGQPGGLG